MPLELGLFLGARRFGDETQKSKRCLVLDIQQYRYQMFISDLAGIDITAHAGDTRRIVAIVRDWLVTVSRRRTIPSPDVILDSYDRFLVALPDIANVAGVAPDQILFADYERMVRAWVKRDHGRN